MQEKKVASASYIIQFYSDVQLLNERFAIFKNHLIELEGMYGKQLNDDNKVDDAHKRVILESVNEVRFYITKTLIAYDSIRKSLEARNILTKGEVLKNLHELAKNIDNELIPKREWVYDYVIGINTSLVEEVIGNLLENSQQIMDNLYNE